MLAKITIADYMSKHILTLKEETPVMDAIKLFLDHKITSAPVLNEQGKVVGMFSEKDCMKVALEAAYNQSFGGNVKEFMNTDAAPVDAQASIVDLVEKFQSSQRRSFPVFDGDKLVGIVSRVDVLKALLNIK